MGLIYKTKEDCIDSLANAFYVRSTQAKCPDTNRRHECNGTDEQIKKCSLATANFYWNRIEDLLKPRRLIDRISKEELLEILSNTRMCDYEDLINRLLKEETI